MATASFTKSSASCYSDITLTYSLHVNQLISVVISLSCKKKLLSWRVRAALTQKVGAVACFYFFLIMCPCAAVCECWWLGRPENGVGCLVAGSVGCVNTEGSWFPSRELNSSLVKPKSLHPQTCLPGTRNLLFRLNYHVSHGDLQIWHSIFFYCHYILVERLLSSFQISLHYSNHLSNSSLKLFV